MLKIERNASLKPYNTFKIDVKASYLIFVHNKDEILELIESDIFKQNSKRLILGGGSNTLFTHDVEGLVIINKIKNKHPISEEKGLGIMVIVGSAESRSNFAKRSTRRDYGGLENLVDIPGTVGAAPVQNIGAYGVEVADSIVRVCGIDLLTGDYKQYENEDCEFGYRTSIFKTTLKQDFFITEVVFLLKKSTRDYTPNLSYKGITEQLEILGYEDRDRPNRIHHNTKAIADAVTHLRASKLPDWTKLGTAGSFFANPIIDHTLFKELKEQYPDLIGHSIGKGEFAYKLSAGQLIELCGFKGYRDGDAGVYDKHALVLVNHGNATGQEMKNLISLIQQTVKKKFSLRLIPEVNII